MKTPAVAANGQTDRCTSQQQFFFSLFLGMMDDLQFYVLFNSISVISGCWVNDNERLCAMEPCLQLRRFRFERDSNSRLLDQEVST